MGETPKNKPLQNRTSDYYVNEYGSVTKKTSAKLKASPFTIFTINEDGSVTRQPKKKSAESRESSRVNHGNNAERKKTSGSSINVVFYGTALYIIAAIIFFILLIINTYEEGETIGNWVGILLGLSTVSWMLYSFIVRPILKWISDLF